MRDVVLWIIVIFKQKTAYEMRISDWSSDVCSSDLAPRSCVLRQAQDEVESSWHKESDLVLSLSKGEARTTSVQRSRQLLLQQLIEQLRVGLAAGGLHDLADEEAEQLRSEERRVGQEWVRTCRSRWAPQHKKKKTTTKPKKK